MGRIGSAEGQLSDFQISDGFLGESMVKVHFQSKVDRGLAEGVGAAQLTFWKWGSSGDQSAQIVKGEGVI